MKKLLMLVVFIAGCTGLFGEDVEAIKYFRSDTTSSGDNLVRLKQALIDRLEDEKTGIAAAISIARKSGITTDDAEKHKKEVVAGIESSFDDIVVPVQEEIAYFESKSAKKQFIDANKTVLKEYKAILCEH